MADHTPGISERRGSTSTFHHGGMKSLDAQSSSSGTLGSTRQYDAFGQVVNATGTWSGPFGHAGGFGYQEDATGLQLLGHRYYDPSTGRFLTRDPIKDGRNWYAYGAGDAAPVQLVDPDGRKKIKLTPQMTTNLVQAIADENWDFFFMLVEAILGITVPQDIRDIIVGAKRPGKLLTNPKKGTGSLLSRLLEHIDKSVENPNSTASKHWRKEIGTFMGNIYKEQRK